MRQLRPSDRSAGELSKLRHLLPKVSGNPTQESPIGDAISAALAARGSAREHDTPDLGARSCQHGAPQLGAVTVLVSIVTAVCASSLPSIDAPVRRLTDV